MSDDQLGPAPETFTSDDPYVEPPNSTVDDWLGQEVDRDSQAVDEAIEEAGGDVEGAERLFEERRPDAR